eukprot:COSAG04_NODE_27282_length_284_cov_2.091892_1_plen_35_part_10
MFGLCLQVRRVVGVKHGNVQKQSRCARSHLLPGRL